MIQDLFRGRFVRGLFPFIALALSFLVCGVMLFCFGIDPIKTYVSIFSHAFGSLNGVSETTGAAIPMTIVAAGIIFVKRVGVFNLGAEGQVLLGALGAQILASQCAGLAAPLALLVTILGGMVFGALWALIPALLRVTLKVNEIVVCIMLNQIALYFIGYLVRGPLKDPRDFNAQSVVIPPGVRMPQFVPDTKIHAGLVLALFLIVAVSLLLKYTTYGYRVRVVGSSERTAVYAGIPAGLTVLSAFLIGGAASGLAGANEVMGVAHRLQGTISNNYGFVGLTVAMIAKNNLFILIAVSVLYSALQVGGLVIQITQHVPMELANIIQAVTVLFVLSADFLYEKTAASYPKKNALKEVEA
ncbi:MAG: ABC transporter permease [Treponema sp.]|jgi:simple sugar transport system permease protein|nr:ABC transporter permease [Treponema sp.]